jgi:enamine deaminase RidA (YjgF/YER057c/UK114 family)
MSRAVRSGPYICVAGTAPIAEGGGTAAPGDVYAQSVRCLDIAEQALQEAGASLADVVRTRVMLTDIGQWPQAARAHAQRFAQVRHLEPFGSQPRAGTTLPGGDDFVAPDTRLATRSL